jgi:hypothetical protein
MGDMCIFMSLQGSCLARHTCCGILPCSTLSDGDIRRTRVKDEERALAEAERDMQENKTVNRGRTSRMQHKVNVNDLCDINDLEGEQDQEAHFEELGIDATYQPKFERKANELTHMTSHPTTKQLLFQIHDDCERLEQHFKAMGAGAENAREKLLARKLQKASIGRVSRGHARGSMATSESTDEAISDDLVFADFHDALTLGKSKPRRR